MEVLPITRQILEQKCIELWVKSWERQKYIKKRSCYWHEVHLDFQKKCIPDSDHRSGKEAGCVGISWLPQDCFYTIAWCPLLLWPAGSLPPPHLSLLEEPTTNFDGKLLVDSLLSSFWDTHICLERGVRVGSSKNSPSWYLEPLFPQTLRLHYWVWLVMQGFLLLK